MTLEALILCLALNIYYEANTESIEGKYAIAHVTMNRLDQNYADNVCKVVYQPKQFSWTADKHLVKPTKQALANAREIATIVISGMSEDPTHGATHFHNQTVRPRWKLKRIKRIGNHTFYKE